MTHEGSKSVAPWQSLLEVTNLGTQLEFWNFCTLEVYSLALILSIMSHLSDSRRLKVCCPLAVTLEVTNLGTQLEFWNFCTLEVLLLSTHPEYHESPE